MYNSDGINSAAVIFNSFYGSRINYILHFHIKTTHKKLRCCAFLKVSAAFAANMGLHFFTNDTFAKLKQIIFLLHARFNFKSIEHQNVKIYVYFKVE